MEEKLRKNRDTLVTIGSGVILFGFWSVIKSVLVCVYQHDLMLELMGDVPDELLYMRVLYVLVAVFAGIDLALRAAVGLAARAEGLGKKRGWGYVVLTGLMAVISAASCVYMVATFSWETYGSVTDVIVTFFVEISNTVIFIELVAAAVRVRRLSGVPAREG